MRPECFNTPNEWSASRTRHVFGARAQPLEQGQQQVLAGERVAGTLHEQHGRLDPRQVRLAPLLELPRRVQRVAEEREAVRPPARRHDLGRDPTAHGAAAMDDAGGAGRLEREVGGGAGGRLEERGGIGAP